VAIDWAILRAHASSSAGRAGVQAKIFRRLGELAALVALYGPSMRIVPTCGKNV
jgi:hypothetical protein